MAATVTVRFKWDRQGVRELKTYEPLLAYTRAAAEGFAAHERSLAPHATGAGAASIQARAPRAQGAWDVAWDSEHHYMAFQEYGTKFVRPPRLFAHRTLEQYIHT